LWKKSIAFASRLYHLSVATREPAFRIKLSAGQLEWLGEVWEDQYEDSTKSEGGFISHSKDNEENYDTSDDRENLHQEQDNAILKSVDEIEAQIDGLSDEVDGAYQRRMLPSSHGDLRNTMEVVESHKTTIPAEQARNRISELIPRFSICFSAEECIDGQIHSSLLVYYAGICSLSVDGTTLRRAKSYTPKPSALIYIQRLLFLKAVASHKAYENITIGQRSQSAHLERLNEVCMLSMVRGCLSTLGEFQSLRDYGQVIARSRPPAFMFRWSGKVRGIVVAIVLTF
jgi:hypothetical protein